MIFLKQEIIIIIKYNKGVGRVLLASVLKLLQQKSITNNLLNAAKANLWQSSLEIPSFRIKESRTRCVPKPSAGA